MILTLPIKKVYFDQILKGSKQKEFRNNTPFYQARFKKTYMSIILHYYSKRRLKAEIQSIQLIKNPFKNHDILVTPQIFAIELKNPRLI